MVIFIGVYNKFEGYLNETKTISLKPVNYVDHDEYIFGPTKKTYYLQFIPVNDKKVATVKQWEQLKKDHDLTRTYGIAIVCGPNSSNTEIVDVDCKYDLTGSLYSRFLKGIDDDDENLREKLVQQKTRNGGFTLIYRCSKVEGNLKLVNRPTTKEEKEETYKKSLQKALEDKAAFPEKNINPEELASKARENDRVRVLIETRGDKGYFVVAPSPGYEFIVGDLSKIQELTPSERDTLLNVARSFNEVFNEYKPAEKQAKKQIKGLTPFEDYNNRADVVALLEKNGWTVVGKKGAKTLMLRPGQTTSESSGNYDENKNWFSVFSTSTGFEPETAYLPYAVFAFIECKKDFSEASRKLYEMGYGDRIERTVENNSKTPSRIDLLSNDYSFIAGVDDYEDYLIRWRKGTFQMGLSTGFKQLDKYFLFKRGDLVVVNGHDNVGKSTVIWYLAVLSAMMHKWKWIIFSSENSVGNVARKLIEFYCCEAINQMSEIKYQVAKKFIKDHFAIIKSDEELYNYRDILNMSKKLLKREKYDGLMIDPYNSLKIELTSASKLSTHEYHYEAVSEMKLFGKTNDLCVYVNCHAVTSALRALGDDKMAKAPQKADTEGGGKFANKADDFITIHRKVQSPDEWMYTELHIRKIKETETGGRVTPLEEPVKIRMVRGLVGFEYEFDNCVIENPVLKYHRDNFVETPNRPPTPPQTNHFPVLQINERVAKPATSLLGDEDLIPLEEFEGF